MENSDYNGAIQLLERVQFQMQYYLGPELTTVSLVSCQTGYTATY